MLDNFVSPYDATVVEKLNAAGMVTLGKTNMDEFAMGSSNETSYYGPVKNPWDLELVPGGSSGGSAAAVAARIAPIATATDTGGSIRQPASLCGVTGIKPTYGRVSRYGMIAFASSLDQGGLIAAVGRGRGDGARRHVRASITRDSTSVDTPVPNYVGVAERAARGPARSASSRSSSRRASTPHVEKLIREALKVYEKLGAKLVEVKLPALPLSVPTYYVVAPAECSSNLARFDGVRYGYRAKDPEGPDGPLQALARRGLRRRGQAPHHDRHLRAVRRLLRRVLPEGAARASADQPGLQARASHEVDVLHRARPRPTSRSASARRASDPIQMYLNDIYTIGANLAGVPAMSIPCGFVARSAGGPADRRAAFRRSEAAQRGARLSEGNRLASRGFPPRSRREKLS